MKANARVVAEHWLGGTVLTDLRSEPPISLRETARGLAIVGSAAGPVAGDELMMEVDVGALASLRIETVATTMVWPGSTAEPSSQELRITVGPGGHLHWVGQPLLVVLGAHHEQEVVIDLAADATLDYVDEVALGRSGELAGHLDARLRVTRGGVPVLDQRQIYDSSDPAWGSTAGVSGHRHVQHRLVVGPPAGPLATSISPDRLAACLPLASDVELMVSVGADRCVALGPE